MTRQGFSGDIEAAIAMVCGLDRGPGNQIVRRFSAAPITGLFDPLVMRQAWYWADAHGTIHRISEMSAEHKAAVVAWIAENEAGLVETARDRILDDRQYGEITPEEHTRQQGVLRLLKPGWNGLTPLVRRLAFGNADPIRCVEEINDADKGQYRVTTKTSTYILDLDEKLVRRGQADTPTPSGPGEFWIHFDYPADFTWMTLMEIVECRVGLEMRTRLVVAGREQPHRTTPIRWIERTSDAPEE